MASRSNRSHVPNSVTSSGPSHPHGRSSGIGATSRARSTDSRPASSAAGAADPASVPIIGHMLLLYFPARSACTARLRALLTRLLPSSLLRGSSVQSAARPSARGRMLSMGDSDGEQAGVLTLAAVPIGRAEDASPRLAAELAGATLMPPEAPRRVRWLAASLSITLSARVISYYDAVETRRAAELVAVLQAGQDVLLVTDAGMPGISAPGYRLLGAAAAGGVGGGGRPRGAR